MSTVLPSRIRASVRTPEALVRRSGQFATATALADAGIAVVAALVAVLAMPVGTRAAGLPFLLGVAASWPALLAVRGAYASRVLGTRDEVHQVVRCLVELTAVASVAVLALGLPLPNPSLLSTLPATLLGSLGARYLIRRRRLALRREGRAVRRVVAVGTGSGITAFVDRLSRTVDHEMVVVGACAEGSDWVVEDVPVVDRLPDARTGESPASDDEAVARCLRAVEHLSVDTVCVTGCSTFTGDRMRALAWALAERNVRLVAVSGLVDVATHRLQFDRAGSVVLAHVHPVRFAGLPSRVKHALDRLAAGVGLVVLSPLLLTVAALVRRTSPGPALYRQTRIGRGGRRFTLVKFRTMVTDADEQRDVLRSANEHDGPMFKIREDPRVTPLGRILRKYSLDELPQLLNVVRGDMSLVGPRPPLPDEVDRYDDPARRRLLVRPGMTGLWQVSGRSDLSWDQAVRLDLCYIDNWSLGLDAILLWRTGPAVMRGRGAY